ncbi:flavodoxin [Metabacillus herbersteinensis]|uniref:Flavodoxin n=1 Tax=Metabacillus herbersteinensis TaxID=283816 RepID=A0ABV6GAL4_9BACI
MSKVLLVYASMSGNTEAIADLLEKSLIESGVEVKKVEAFDADLSLFEEYKSILLGAYTWGDGDLPDEMLDLYEEMDDHNFSSKQFAVFGSGDTSYDDFCGAVDLLQDKIIERGGEIICEALKIEFNPEGEDVEKCLQFVKMVAAKISA